MQRLPEAELDIMLALWGADGAEVSRAYFDEKLSHKRWNANTINSFLSRLQEKGFVMSVRRGKMNYYTASVTREKYLAQEGKTILSKLYNNSIKSFVLSISEADALRDDEIAELQAYLDNLRKGKPNA